MKSIAALLLVSAYMAVQVSGHGRLMNPPCRATMWRVGYDTPPDYNDNQLFCGGKSHQYDTQGGKCGICGDAYDEPQPRTHEIGGPYYKGIIVRNYAVGQEIKATVQITANHLGFFQFKMCPVSGDVEATQECLDKTYSDGGRNQLYLITTSQTEVRDFDVTLQLPEDLECEALRLPVAVPLLATTGESARTALEGTAADRRRSSTDVPTVSCFPTLGLHQYDTQGGKCGICGDAYDEPQPRTHEIGGPYYKGIIVRNYAVGQEIKATVQITANHLGFFQFKMCPVSGDVEATQECLDKHILTVAGTNSTDYYITDEVRDFDVTLQLPEDLECEHCVFQWRYHAGNDWGVCPDGTGRDGCGPQEEFYGCADVSVSRP
ncbi:hypothetical protein FJT64_021747 [Amphibalanus amphitrite]|uniref:Chitin-binding type-4 domain-containing protein n=1 Tax=Amphibalanus amphitrite TaxID=1232801 RepID=A0A6A4WT57_AMPAM|nr:hypothetical protein FJT64_021747 [Amphibalanus amphitrite]